MSKFFEFSSDSDSGTDSPTLSPEESPVGSPAEEFKIEKYVNELRNQFDDILIDKGKSKIDYFDAIAIKRNDRNPEHLLPDEALWINSEGELNKGDEKIAVRANELPDRSVLVWDANQKKLVASAVNIDEEGNLGGIQKLSMDGLIDPPTGLALTQVATNPGTGQAYENDTIWKSSATGNYLYMGTPSSSGLSITTVPALGNTANGIPVLSGTAGGSMSNTIVAITPGTSGGAMSGLASLAFSTSTNAITTISTATTLGSSDVTISSQNAVKSYIDGKQQDYYNLTSDPTGMTATDRTNSTISFNDGTYTLSIAPVSGSFYYYIKGTKYTVSSQIDKVITNTTGLYYYYLDNTGVILEKTSFDIDDLKQYCYFATVYWNDIIGTHILLGDERHEFMPWQSHWNIHMSTGCIYQSGLALSNFVIGDGSLNTHAQFDASAGVILDEDITHSITAKTGGTDTWTVLYFTGDQGWKSSTGNYIPAVLDGTTSRLYYNDTSSGLAETSGDGYYVLAHIVATNETTANNGFMAVMGQNEYATLEAAQAAVSTETNALTLAGLPMSEWVFVGTIIYQTSSAYSNTRKARVIQNLEGQDYTSWLNRTFNPTTTPGSHSALSGLGNDDHQQYMRAQGTGTLAGADNTLVRMNGTSGRITQSCGVTVSDGDAINGFSGLQFGTTGVNITSFSSDSNLGTSDAVLSTQYAVKQYVDAKMGGTVNEGNAEYLAFYSGTPGQTSFNIDDINVKAISVNTGTYNGLQGHTFDATSTTATAPGLMSDYVGEHTAAAGVTVDGVKMKDSGVGLATVASNPASADTTLWASATSSLRVNANYAVMNAGTNAVVANSVAIFTGTSPNLVDTCDVIFTDAGTNAGCDVTGIHNLTMTGLLDPTGVVLIPQVSNPGGASSANTLWIDTANSILRHDTYPIIEGPTSATTADAIVKWGGTTGSDIVNTGITIDGSNNMSGAATISCTTSYTDDLYVNRIVERQLNVGVTIESTLLKDGGVKIAAFSTADPNLGGNYLWSNTAGELQNSTNSVMQIAAGAVTARTIPVFNGTTSSVLTNTGVTIDSSNYLTAVRVIGTTDVQTDTVTERTAGSGVTIDSLQIKDASLKLHEISVSPFNLQSGEYSIWIESTSKLPRFNTYNTPDDIVEALIVGPTTSVDNVMVKFDGTYSKIQTTGITIADTTNDMSGVGAITMVPGATTGANTIWMDVSTNPTNVLKRGTTPIVTGPTSTVDKHLPTWNGTLGHALNAGNILVDDTNSGIVYSNNWTGNAGEAATLMHMDKFATGENMIFGIWDNGLPSFVDNSLPLKASWTIGVRNVVFGAGNFKFDGGAAAYNTVFGSGSLIAITDGGNNIAVGRSTGNTITTGSDNVCVGRNANVSAADAIGQIAIGSNTSAGGNYYCQIGQSGQASQSAKMNFRSQTVCDETWRDTNTRVATIDGTGNMTKSSYSIDQSLTTTSDVHFASAHITGKLTVDGMIDPIGLEFTPHPTNEGGKPEHTIWVDTATQTMKVGVYQFVKLTGDTPRLNTIPRWTTEENCTIVQRSELVIEDSGTLISPVRAGCVLGFDAETSAFIGSPSNNLAIKQGVGLILASAQNIEVQAGMAFEIKNGNTTLLRVSGNGVEGDVVLDENDMATNSAQHLPTQRSVRAFVENKFGEFATAGQMSTTFLGPWQGESDPVIVRWSVVDHIVTIQIQALSRESLIDNEQSALITSTAPLPEALFPIDGAIRQDRKVQDGTPTDGFIEISRDGFITIARASENGEAGFAMDGATKGFNTILMQYFC